MEELKSILNDEDHFEKVMWDFESEDKTLGKIFHYSFQSDSFG